MQLIQNRKFRYLLLFMVVVTTIYFLYLVREVVYSFLLAGLLAYFLYRPVNFIENKGIKRIWAILILYVLFLGMLTVVLWFAIPTLVKELSDIGKLFPVYADQAQDVARQIDGMNLPDKFEQIIKENASKIENKLYNSLRGFITGLYNFFSRALILIFAPILAFYLLKDWTKIGKNFLNLFSPAVQRDIMAIISDIDSVLIEFFKGHLLVSTLVGIMTGISAALIGVKFALLIGLISGVSNLIPYFGSILGGIPAVALALSESTRLAVYMGIAVLLIQQLEGNIITPKIIGVKLGMHPLLVVFALLAGGKLLGIWGMLFAVPLTAVMKIILRYLFLKMVEQ